MVKVHGRLEHTVKQGHWVRGQEVSGWPIITLHTLNNALVVLDWDTPPTNLPNSLSRSAFT